jgi:hypothetical protein
VGGKSITVSFLNFKFKFKTAKMMMMMMTMMGQECKRGPWQGRGESAGMGKEKEKALRGEEDGSTLHIHI